jgi:phage terminase large subunit-like protein
VPGQFAVGLAQITFQGQLQKPYRAERLLVSTVRNTATAVGRLLGVLYVGTDLQQAEIAGWDIELIGQAGSFGTRLTCQQAEPGVLIRLVVTCQPALSVAGDTISTNIMFLGRVIH